MILNNIAIHVINKEKSGETELILSPAPLSIGEIENTLSIRLNYAFRSDKRVLKTVFNNTKSKSFQKQLFHFVKARTVDAFWKWTVDAMNDLLDIIRRVPFATGGYYVFLDYTIDEVNFIGVFGVKDEDGLTFDVDEEGNYKINNATVVDISKLTLAARVRVDHLEGNRYLHFTKRQEHVTQYFLDWIDADVADRSEEDTKELIKLINLLPDDKLPILIETGNRFEREDFKKVLFDFIQAQGNMVRLHELGLSYWNDENYLIACADELNLTISHEFQGVLNALKLLKRYEIKHGKIKLVFTQNDIDEGVVRKVNNNELIINDTNLVASFDELIYD